MQLRGLGLGSWRKKKSENPGAREIAELSFRKCRRLPSFHPMLHETRTTVTRGHLSSSVVTWSKELDFRFKPELEVELTIFTNTLVWIWGLILSETRVSQGHSEAPWWTREFLVCPSTLGWAGGLGFHSPFAPAMNWRENSLRVFQPDMAFRSQVRGRGMNTRHQLLPTPSCPGGASALLLYCPHYFQWHSWLPPTQTLSSFHQPCATFCSASWGSSHSRFFFFLLATNYGKTGTQEEVSPRTKMLWALVHRAADPWSCDPDQCLTYRSGATAT